MPDVLNLFGFRVVIYYNDHQPAHVHVVGKGIEAVFELNCPNGPSIVRTQHRFPRKDLIRIWGEIDALEGTLMGISDVEFEAATRRGELMQAIWPAAIAVRYDSVAHRIVISLSSRIDVSFSPSDAQGFEDARPEDLATAEISPSGFGVSFPKINADIYIPGLLQGRMGSERWMAARRATGEPKERANVSDDLGGEPTPVRPML